MNRGHEELKARILRHDQSYVNLENAVVRADRREWSADDANAEDARKVSKGSKRGEKNRFLNLLAVEWGKICHDTDEEDWNPFFPSDCRLGNSEDGYFRRRSDRLCVHCRGASSPVLPVHLHVCLALDLSIIVCLLKSSFGGFLCFCALAMIGFRLVD
jgi:hypothetical protein